MLRSKLFQGVKCVEKQSELGCKVCVSRVTLPVESKLDVVFRDDTSFFSSFFDGYCSVISSKENGRIEIGSLNVDTHFTHLFFELEPKHIRGRSPFTAS